jgi:hypothetical protein
MHLRFILSFCWIVLCFGNSAAQTGILCTARSLAISGADIAGSSEWSGIDNPAGLGDYSHYYLGVSYQNRFMIPELGSQLLCGTIPTTGGTFSPVINYFGSKSLNRMNLSLAYGLSLNAWFSAGIKLGYHRVAVEATMHQASAITGDLAVIVKPLEGFALGAMLVNPTRTRYNNFSGERLPGSLQLGISYSGKNTFCIASKLNWDDFQRLICSFGAEYELYKFLSIRAGIWFPDRLSYSFGLGMSFGLFRFDLGGEQHPLLGLSSAISLSYKIR